MSTHQRGRFIVIDGTDGAGKSTMAQTLVRTLQQRGIDVHLTREPGGTPACEDLRAFILGFNYDSEPLDPDTELLLMFAARNQHTNELIKPKLEQGTWIVCDRYTTSTLAYQGFGRGMDPQKILDLHDQFVSIAPDTTLIFDLDPETARQRLNEQDTVDDHFEKEKSDFFDRVRQGYHYYAETFPEESVLIDASQSINEVKRSMMDALERRIGLPPLHRHEVSYSLSQ